MKYLKHFPKPLLDDLVNGRWLPVVGAGLSKSAVLSSQRKVPLWNELGENLANDMPNYGYVNPIDAISAYAHEFGRPKLIEKLSDLVSINEAKPGTTHRAFCALQFDIVCTTNFDFLLERQYELTPRSCTPLIDEDQLSINLHGSSIALLKLHGDLNHPKRLIITEEDYDKFLERYPVIATYLANLLITRTAVLIGYSLDDPDFRQVWQVVGERLGKARRLAYVLCVGAEPAEVARFQRRGVKVINLAGAKSRYGEILSKAFDELRDYWRENIVAGSQVIEVEPLRELSLPGDAATRLCFFALPLSAQPFYREQVFPLVRKVGLVPLTADEVVSPGENVVAKIDALISRAFLVVVDASSEFTLAEARMAFARNEPDRLLVIIEEGASIPIAIQQFRILYRPDLASVLASVDSVEGQRFFDALKELLQKAAEELGFSLPHEAQRLLRAHEYRAAVISAITQLEAILREQFELSLNRDRQFVSLRKVLAIAAERGLLGQFNVQQISQWLKLRNEIVHSHEPVSPKTAREIVLGVDKIRGFLLQ